MFYRHIGCCRFVWNHMLAEHIKAYEARQKTLYGPDMTKMLTKLKSEENFGWLKEVSAYSLNRICKDLDRAFSMFFKRISGYPKFKSKKKQNKSFPVRTNENRFYFTKDFVKVEKIGKIRYGFENTGIIGKNKKFYDARIYLKNNKWILSVVIDCENQAVELTDKSLGIDLGIKELAVCSFGGEKLVFHSINKTKRMKNLENKLKHIQRTISRKYRVNGNYDKTNGIIRYENILRGIFYRMSCIRENYTHQTTHYLVSLLPNKVIMEDLNIQGMIKNKHLSKHVCEQGLFRFITQMRYKCAWYGIDFVQVDRFYPSSKTCSNCGHIKKDLKLSDRIYRCPECGLEIDRDFNAALNLEKYVAN